jgi:hypothetical protein
MPDPQLIIKLIEVFAAWASLSSFLDEHPPTVEMNIGWQNKWKGVLRRSEAWMIALFLALRAGTKGKPFTLRELAGVLVEPPLDGDETAAKGCDGDRLKTAMDSLKKRYLPAFEAYELAQVTWVVDHYEIVATEKLLAFLDDCYSPKGAAKEGDPSDEV